jgi:hypothetical protein
LLSDDRQRQNARGIDSLRTSTGSDLSSYLNNQQEYRILRRAHYDIIRSDLKVGEALEAAIKSELISVAVDSGAELPEREQAVTLLQTITSKVGDRLRMEYARSWDQPAFRGLTGSRQSIAVRRS